jgi:1-deoxy-D-xylulose-5-phosphate reductoisomerase
MRTPIAHALAWPDRIESGVDMLDLVACGRFDFTAPDLDAFPCLRLAFEALARGGRAPAVLNAANEVAVAAFLDGRIGFLQIPEIIESTLDAIDNACVRNLGDVLEADALARAFATSRLTADA